MEQYSIGTKKRLELNVTIRNGGEDAFESMLYVTMPPDVNYVNIDKSKLVSYWYIVFLSNEHEIIKRF